MVVHNNRLLISFFPHFVFTSITLILWATTPLSEYLKKMHIANVKMAIKYQSKAVVK